MVFLFGNASCKKLVDVSAPVTSINGDNVYDNDATAAAVLTGMYTNMVNYNNLGSAISLLSISFYAGMSADELTLFSGENDLSYTQFYTNTLASANINPDFWSILYQMAYVANAAIEGLNATSGLTPAVKQQALGEALFMRAFIYFYLVNLYGDVPLVLTTDYKLNAVITRTPQAQVWQQIIMDLTSAESILSPNYLDGTLENTVNQRFRPTKWAAAALLARAYLYTGAWDNAAAWADTVISNSSLFALGPLNTTFLTNSTEAIWQLQPVQFGWNTLDAQTFIIPSSGLGGNWPVYLSPPLLNAFEPTDQRRTTWVDSINLNGTYYYYPYKYRSDSLDAPVTEYEMVLRLGEQFLIRAEAEANGAGGTGPAVQDLNSIRARAGLGPYNGSMAVDSVLQAIYHERQVELFTEWGHRWFDLKRTATINSVMGSPGNVCIEKSGPGSSWSPEWQWYPIALSQLRLDPYLVQNPGY